MVTKAPYTPGEWVVNGRTAAGWRIDSLAGERVGLDFLLHPVALTELEANAILIAAAPELLQALVSMLDYAQGYKATLDTEFRVSSDPPDIEWEEAVTKAIAVIAKAQGKE